MFTEEQIRVIMKAFEKMANAVKAGKNLDVVIVKSALLIPPIDNVLMAYKQSEEIAIALGVEVPESTIKGKEVFEGMKKYILDIIKAGSQVMQKQTCNN